MVLSMFLILDGSSEHVAHMGKKTGRFLLNIKICDYSRSKQMPETDHITDFTLNVRTTFWDTIWYRYHGFGGVPVSSIQLDVVFQTETLVETLYW